MIKIVAKNTVKKIILNTIIFTKLINNFIFYIL